MTTCRSSCSLHIPVARLAIALFCSGPLCAEVLQVDNAYLAVLYDTTTHQFSVKELSGSKTFLRQGRLLDAPAARAQILPATDPVFGKGRKIQIDYTDKSSSSLELFPKLPFLLIRTELYNSNRTETTLRQIEPAIFKLHLDARSANLRTLGTAGLMTPNENPGSYLFLTLADPATRRGVVAGWLTEDKGSGVLFSSNEADAVTFRARVDYGRLSLGAGGSTALETLAIGFFEDARIGEELYADAVARQYRIRLHPQINGYCTWYSNPHGGAADENAIIQLAEVAAKELKPFGFSFIQIDDKWQDGKERNGPARRFYRAKPDGPYPHGLQPVCDKLKQLGLTTGLWFLPFASDWQDPEFKDRQNWFVKRQDGRPFETDWGNTSLDLTEPQVQKYLADMVRTIHSWGINYFKMDGLWTGTATEQIYVNDGYHEDHIGTNAPFFDPRKTNIEAMRDGLKLLRQAAGPDVFFSGCNLSQNMRSLAGSIGLVDSMRIGPDNGQRWRDYREEITKNDSGSLVTGPVRGTRLYFMNGRFWWNDPDPCYVRESIPLAQARLITSWVALSGQFNLNSDWLPGLPAERLDVLKRTMPAHGALARPVDYFDSIMPGIWLVTDNRQAVRRDVIGLFNWDSHDRALGYEAGRAGLDPLKNYYAFDFWSNAPAKSFQGRFAFDVPGRSCRVVAVRPIEDHPVLVSTSRHVSQGIVDVTDEKWSKADGILSGASQVVGRDPYQLRVAGLKAGPAWKLVSATVSPADAGAGVTIVAEPGRPGEEGWQRLDIQSQAGRWVKWRLQFVHE